MKKHLLTLSLALVLFLTGCSSYTLPITDSLSDTTAPEATENPFEDTGSNIIGEIGHGPRDVSWSDDGEVLPFAYEGGEFSLDYYFSASGRADSIGFLLYLDGKPQPYEANGMEGLSYCHAFPMEESVEKDITFRFTPIAGKAGDTLGLTILSVYYPNFKPNMVESSSYGFYQGILINQIPITYYEDAPEEVPLPSTAAPEAVSVETRDKKITKDFLENELPANGVMDVEAIEDWPYYTITYDDQLLLDHLDLTGKDTITVRYKLCGPAGKKFNTIFYLDHQPISCDGTLAYEATLTKGGVWVAELTLDISKLQDFSTFYVISVPAGYDRNQSAIKTGSILFYKEN